MTIPKWPHGRPKNLAEISEMVALIFCSSTTRHEGQHREIIRKSQKAHPSKTGQSGEPEAQNRGGGGKPKGGGSDGGRGDSLMATAASEETPNIAGDYAANILSNPTEGQQENYRGISNGEATARTDVTATSANDNPRSGDVGRSETSRQMTGEQSHSSGQDRHNDKANDADRSDGPQDLSAREARDGFPDDGQGNGI